MKVATQDEVAAHFSEYVKAARKGPVVVTCKGKPVAVLLSSQTEEEVERLLPGALAESASDLGSRAKTVSSGARHSP